MGVIVIAALVCAVLYLCYLCFWRSNSSSDLTGEQNTLPDLTGEQNTLPDLTAEQRIANEPQISFAQRRENAFRKRRKAKASTPAKKNDSPALKTPFAQRRENGFRKRRKAKVSTPAKKNDSPALKTPSALWEQRKARAFAAFSAKRPSASSSSSWRPPRVPLKQDECYPWNATDINGNERRTRQLVRKEILMGKTSPAMKADVIANLGK